MFTNKVVLITGCSYGLGKTIAQEFAKHGAKLVITTFGDEELLKRAAKECEAKSPCKYKPLCFNGDLTKEANVKNLMKNTIEHYKGLDVLINNAGLMQFGSILKTSMHQFDTVFNINVRAVFQITMLAAPHLIKSKGNIVNMSSVAGTRSFSDILPYCMSKAAIDQFTKCVALELGGAGVRVNAVNPGVIDTGIHLRGGMKKAEYEKYLEKCKHTHVLGRIGTAKEVAETIIFLASDAASYITGATVPIDGGRHVMCPR